MTLRERIQTNSQILKLLDTLKREHRAALPHERELLQQWSSAGSLAAVFDAAKTDWEDQRSQWQALLSREDYRDLAASVTGSYYTPPVLVQALAEGLQQLGFYGGTVLEPAAGTGAMIQHLPEGLRQACQFTAIEACPVAGTIARHALADVNVIVKPFEDLPLTGVTFDAVIANPPFSSARMGSQDLDQRLSEHSFFLARALQALRPGGILAAVVSRFFLDRHHVGERSFFTERARLLGALRLPNTAFSSENTQVVTDLVFLQRLANDETGNSPMWLETVASELWPGDGPRMTNRYFVDHPAQVLGRYALGRSEGGREMITVRPDTRTLAEALKEGLAALPWGVYQRPVFTPPTVDGVDHRIQVSDVIAVRMYGFAQDVDGNLVQRLPDRLDKPCFARRDTLPKTTQARIRGLMHVRDALRELLEAERLTSSDADLSHLRRTLNTRYDAFVRRFSAIHSLGNQRAYGDDPDYALLQGLEYEYDSGISKTVAAQQGIEPKAPSWQKATLFTRRCSAPFALPDAFENPLDALLACVREQGQINLPWIAARCEPVLSIDALTQTLCEQNRLFHDPVSQRWELSEAYLSGDVVSKLTEAQAARAQDARYQRNVDALDAIQPAPIHPAEIHITLGASWTPPDVLAAFIYHLCGQHPRRPPVLAGAEWFFDLPYTDKATEEQKLGTAKLPFRKLFPRLLNNESMTVWQTLIDGSRRKDLEATVEAEAKAAEIRQLWQDWVWSDSERAQRLADRYNTRFNRWVERQFNGQVYRDHNPPGLNPALSLREPQANALWRGLQEGGCLYDHPVGAGKTLLGVTLTMELRRLGLARRVVIVAPNHLLGVWRTEFARAYPAAQVLCATPQDMEKSKRGRLFARMLTSCWDAILLPMSSFEFIAVPPRDVAQHINEQVAELLDAEDAILEQEGKSRNHKRMQARRKQLQEKLRALSAASRKDGVLYWDELAPDALLVDESDLYKNLYFTTQHHDVVGLGNPEGSRRAFDMYLKIRWLRERQKGRGVYFLTGTPISNSLVELHTLFRYLAPERLAQCGLTYLDNWLRQYAIPETRYELSATGTYKPVTAFRRFVNVPELLSQYRLMADSVSEAELKRFITLPDGRSAIPPLKDGQFLDVVAERSALQAAYMEDILHRAQHLPADPSEDNFLKIMNDARTAALDMRLLHPKAPDFEGSKVNRLVDNVYHEWQRWQQERGTQIVFLDSSTPKAAWNVYDDIKDKLMQMGVPAQEIAFAQSAKTDLQTAALHEQVRQGRVRILLGSTAKLGAGVNVQNRLTALHLLDCGYRPRDAQQRIGRALRQGNQLYEADPDQFAIAIYRYGTALTLDALLYQINERKAGFINQILKGTSNGRVVEDLSDAQANLAQMKAALSGNPLIVQHVELSMQVQQLE
ncbi:MAG: N-6 DNA methylase, partial [Candidatus Competibacteraceae bacterium]|nr:N-6 DNA methylase [Candidatus Competibacteraceae bacterium]